MLKSWVNIFVVLHKWLKMPNSLIWVCRNTFSTQDKLELILKKNFWTIEALVFLRKIPAFNMILFKSLKQDKLKQCNLNNSIGEKSYFFHISGKLVSTSMIKLVILFWLGLKLKKSVGINSKIKIKNSYSFLWFRTT